MAASGDGSGYLLTLVSPMFISSQKRRLRARHMSVPLQPQIFAAMAFVTHWVKCAAVGTPDRSRTSRERSASIAFCRLMRSCGGSSGAARTQHVGENPVCSRYPGRQFAEPGVRAKNVDALAVARVQHPAREWFFA